jgi:propionyl-CoA carboxylase alpha chain
VQNIDIFYDPMISKLIAHGTTRDEACAKLATALDSYVVRGVDHNIPFLRACLSNPRFLSGAIKLSPPPPPMKAIPR